MTLAPSQLPSIPDPLKDSRIAALIDAFAKASVVERRIPGPDICARAEDAIAMFRHHAEAIAEQLECALRYAEQENLPWHKRPDQERDE